MMEQTNMLQHGGLVLLCLMPAVLLADAWCTFPESWHGRWYESSAGVISVGLSTITDKGTCIDNVNDHYLMEDSEMDCTRCLHIINRHENILQYRQSFCIGHDSIMNVCARISTAGILYTLIREDARPIPCPFQDSYRFVYDNQTGYCDYPRSYTKACASTSNFRFKFEHCEGLWETPKIDLDFKCLATWSSGANFMYGIFNWPGFTNKDYLYRCFMYELQGTMIWMSMSQDSTCRGLISPTDGPMKMELTRDQLGWPNPTCTFPSWLTHASWRDLSGKYTLQTDGNRKVLRMHHQDTLDEYPETAVAFRCLYVDIRNTTESRFIAVTHTLDGCNDRHECLRIIKKDKNVLEVHRGGAVYKETMECKESDFKNITKYLVIPTHLRGIKCPIGGHFVTSKDGCTVDISSACESPTEMKIATSCTGIKGGYLECLTTWRNRGHTYLVAKEAGGDALVANCFKFRNHSNGMVTFQTDRRCNINTPNIFTHTIKYSFKSSPEKCVVTIPRTTTRTMADTGKEEIRKERNNAMPKKAKSLSNSAAKVKAPIIVHFMLVFISAFVTS